MGGSASPCILCENAARFNDNASEMFGFGYSLFHQWPRFRLWAQQSDPCQHCRDHGRILQIVPALAGQAEPGCGGRTQVAIAGRAAQDRQDRQNGQRASRPGACRRASAACTQRRLQRQGRLGRTFVRARRPLPPATGQGGQTASRLSLRQLPCRPPACSAEGPARHQAPTIRPPCATLRVGVEWSTLFTTPRKHIPLAAWPGRASMSLPI